jgi:hypothetical protein
MDASAQECADRQHDGGSRELQAHGRDDPGNATVLDAKIGNLGLEQRQVRLIFDDGPDRLAIERSISLRPGRPYGGPLACVQRAELDPGAVDRSGHRATERIDFLDEVPLADAADGGIAAHLAERLDALRDQQRARPHPGRRKGSLGAGVTAAHHDDLEWSCKTHIGERWLA